MKIVICTTPIDHAPTDYPPLGSLAVIQALRGAGYDPVFIDIDGLRPAFNDAIAQIAAEAPDVVGISAVVSTAYGYTKRLSTALREALPDTRLVLGGNLAASAEVLHRKCGIHACVIGEGVRPMVNLVDYYRRHRHTDDFADLEQVKGITFLAPSGDMAFTGYDAAIPANELLDPDFSILERYSDIGLYVNEPLSRPDFGQDPRSYQPHRAGKKMSTVVTSKGCVARCTFCHRWDRGFRQMSPEKVIGRIRYLVDQYNVGFISIGDENFGSDQAASDRLIDLIAPLDILWKVSGMRARTIQPDRLKRMHDAGCVAVYYGFETGSPDILKVMEKNLGLDDNLRAARATHAAGLFTMYQLVLGMPGESPETIRDTIEMVKQITEFMPEPPYRRLSINYAQALPGTPLYEYARLRGLIGPTLDDEEAYLQHVSDVPAGSDTTFLNFTAYPYVQVQTWRPAVLFESTLHWAQHKRQSAPTPAATAAPVAPKTARWGSYFNLLDFRYDERFLIAVAPLRGILIWGWTLMRLWRRCSATIYGRRLWELVTWPVRRKQGLREYASLRQVMRSAPAPVTPSEQAMMPLRLGR